MVTTTRLGPLVRGCYHFSGSPYPLAPGSCRRGRRSARPLQRRIHSQAPSSRGPVRHREWSNISCRRSNSARSPLPRPHNGSHGVHTGRRGCNVHGRQCARSWHCSLRRPSRIPTKPRANEPPICRSGISGPWGSDSQRPRASPRIYSASATKRRRDPTDPKTSSLPQIINPNNKRRSIHSRNSGTNPPRPRQDNIQRHPSHPPPGSRKRYRANAPQALPRR